MFNRVMKKVDSTAGTNEIETVIGENTNIDGQITGSGHVRIDGHVKGGVSIGGRAVIGTNGLVEGDVSAQELLISGTLRGNVETQGALSIDATGELVGDAKAHSFSIADGGVFNGRSIMQARSRVEPDNVQDQDVK